MAAPGARARAAAPRPAPLQLPTRTRLDALAPNNPVVIVAENGHAASGNIAAFTLAGIGEDTPNPVGAQFLHGPGGELTGEVSRDRPHAA